MSVDAAVSTIKDNLSQGIFDWDVTRGELQEIHRVLSELAPAERNEAISRLSDDDLGNWAQEVHGTLGDLSAGEREALFNTLAEGLDATQLVRVVNAFEGQGHGDSVRELGTAVATHGSSETRVAFVEAMAERTVDGRSSYDPAPTHRNDVTGNLVADPDAQAVAEVLASLQGSYFDQAVGALSDTQLGAVMQAGIYQAETSSRNGTITNFDTAVAARVVDAAASSSDPAVQARIFDAAADRLGIIQGGGDQGAVPGSFGTDGRLAPARDELTGALTRLINADTTGIVQQLETTERNGDALTTYLTEQIAAGREAEIGELILKLQSGNDLSGDPIANFEAETPDGDRQNAHVLGYFTGAIEAAVRNVTDDKVAQAEAIGDIFKGVINYASIAGGAAAPSPAGPGISTTTSAITHLTEAFVDDAVAEIRADGGRLHDELTALAYPHDAEGVPYEGERSETAFDTARGRVLDAQSF